MARIVHAADDSLGHLAAFCCQKSRILSEVSVLATYMSSSSWCAMPPIALPVKDKWLIVLWT